MRHCFESASLIFRGVSPPPAKRHFRERGKKPGPGGGGASTTIAKQQQQQQRGLLLLLSSHFANRSLVLETRDAFGCCETERWIKLLPSSLFVADATTTISLEAEEGKGRKSGFMAAGNFFCQQHQSKQWFFVCFSATSVLLLKLHFCSPMGGAWALLGFSCLLPNL